jgi:hypothetical protein
MSKELRRPGAVGQQGRKSRHLARMDEFGSKFLVVPVQTDCKHSVHVIVENHRLF